MASIPFTLAALATSAVPGLMVSAAREHQAGDDFVSAVIAGTVAEGSDAVELLVRVPRTQAAQVQQSAELLGLAALTDGPRSQLPFEVPRAIGMTRAGDTRAVVTTFVEGASVNVSDLEEDAILLGPIAAAIAAIHDLPLSVAQQGGIPVRSTTELRERADRLIDRADHTRLLPETVMQRWKRTIRTDELWDFAPLIVHGALDAEQLRFAGAHVSGVLGWAEFSAGDPASDLSWLLTAGPDVLDTVLAHYAEARNAGAIAQIRARASLYHELEVARWLLHGVESHDQSVVDDAVAMLDRLVSTGGVFGAAIVSSQTRTPLDEHEVSSLLEETPDVTDRLSETAAYEALDEDRVFTADTDFIEPLPAGESERAAQNRDHADGLGDQVTEPIDPADLPDAPGAAGDADPGVRGTATEGRAWPA